MQSSNSSCRNYYVSIVSQPAFSVAKEMFENSVTKLMRQQGHKEQYSPVSWEKLEKNSLESIK